MLGRVGRLMARVARLDRALAVVDGSGASELVRLDGCGDVHLPGARAAFHCPYGTCVPVPVTHQAPSRPRQTGSAALTH